MLHIAVHTHVIVHASNVCQSNTGSSSGKQSVMLVMLCREMSRMKIVSILVKQQNAAGNFYILRAFRGGANGRLNKSSRESEGVDPIGGSPADSN